MPQPPLKTREVIYLDQDDNPSIKFTTAFSFSSRKTPSMSSEMKLNHFCVQFHSYIGAGCGVHPPILSATFYRSFIAIDRQNPFPDQSDVAHEDSQQKDSAGLNATTHVRFCLIHHFLDSRNYLYPFLLPNHQRQTYAAHWLARCLRQSAFDFSSTVTSHVHFTLLI